MFQFTAILVFTILAGYYARASDTCSEDALDACMPPLNSALGVTLTSPLSVVEASPDKVKAMCMSETKNSTLECWNEAFSGCEDHSVKFTGTRNVGTLTFMCGKGIEGFEINQDCLSSKKTLFEGCFMAFFMGMEDKTGSDPQVMCNKLYSLDVCMANMAKPCGSSGMDWARDFGRAQVQYLGDMYQCSTMACTYLSMDSCISPLETALDVRLPSTLSIVEAKTAQVKQMCMSDIKSSSSLCLNDAVNECDDWLVSWRADMFVATVDYMCGQGMSDFERSQSCLDDKAVLLEACFGAFLYNLTEQTSTDQSFMCSKLYRLDTCMTKMVETCGDSAVSWTRGFRRAQTRYMQNNYVCSAISGTADFVITVAFFLLSMALF